MTSILSVWILYVVPLFVAITITQASLSPSDKSFKVSLSVGLEKAWFRVFY